jgi:hypothetical protein
LRGALAVYVMLSHLAPFAAWPALLAWIPGMLSHGMAGVDVFFILSGLVILRSLASFGGHALPFLIARTASFRPSWSFLQSRWRSSHSPRRFQPCPGLARAAPHATSGPAGPPHGAPTYSPISQ